MWKTAGTICRIATFRLNSGLKHLILLRLMPWIGMNANQVVTFVILRSFVCHYVPPHQIAHDKVLGTGGDDR